MGPRTWLKAADLAALDEPARLYVLPGTSAGARFNSKHLVYSVNETRLGSEVASRFIGLSRDADAEVPPDGCFFAGCSCSTQSLAGRHQAPRSRILMHSLSPRRLCSPVRAGAAPC